MGRKHILRRGGAHAVPGRGRYAVRTLPEGYFTGERMAPVWVFWAFAGAGALLAAYTLLRALSARRRAPVVTPECTPPDGVSSAEVGYIITIRRMTGTSSR